MESAESAGVSQGSSSRLPKPQALACAVFDAYLTAGEGATAGREALRLAASHLGVAASDLVVTEGDLGECFAGGAVSEDLLRAARSLLARGYVERLRELPAEARPGFEIRVVRAAAAMDGALSVAVGLEEAGVAPELSSLLDRAMECARTLDGTEPLGDELPVWLEALESPGTLTDSAAEAIAAASLALEGTEGRSRRLRALFADARSGHLLRFLAELPEVRQDGELVRELWESARAAARAAVVWTLSRSNVPETLLPAVLDCGEGPLRLKLGAQLFTALWESGSEEIAARVARTVGRGWPARESISGEVLRGSLASISDKPRAAFLCSVGSALGEEGLERAVAAYEVAFDLAERLLVVGSSFAEMAGMVPAVAALAMAGRTSSVAARLGESAAAIRKAGVSLAPWAELNLACARTIAETGAANDALLFYVNLVAAYEGRLGRLADFGPAAPLLGAVRAKLLFAPTGAGVGAKQGVFARLEHQRRMQTLAEELRRIDACGFEETTVPDAPALSIRPDLAAPGMGKGPQEVATKAAPANPGKDAEPSGGDRSGPRPGQPAPAEGGPRNSRGPVSAESAEGRTRASQRGPKQGTPVNAGKAGRGEPRRDVAGAKAGAEGGSAPQNALLVELAEGVRLNPPTRGLQMVRVFTGYEFVRALFSLVGRALRYRRAGRLQILRDAVIIEQSSHLLGHPIRLRRQEVPASAVSEIRRVDRAPTTLLVLGVLLLIVLTWFGVSVAFDGFSIRDGVLIGGGFGAVALGLLLDAVLYGVFRAVKGSTTLTLTFKDSRRSLRLAVPRADADRVLTGLRSLSSR
jgi:hypothetical protein